MTTWNDIYNATTKEEFVNIITIESWDFTEVYNNPINIDKLINDDICRTLPCSAEEFNKLREKHGFSDDEMLQVAKTTWLEKARIHNISWEEEYGAEIERLAEKDD